ncbi:MAG: hypothetical protein JO288_08915, partial [Hyphomicrobiales bacterium]|nr:hypothetical protein [Hyphomicrobiales bacterium]
AALASTAAAPGGAQKVADAVSNSDPDLLTKLAAAVGGGNVAGLNEGANLLGGLLGGSALPTLAGALGQYAGASPSAAQPLIGAVAQSVIGTIGQQDPSSWSDASSIAALFNGQKGAIAAALPPEISRMLSATGLLAGVAPTATPAAAPIPPPPVGAPVRPAAPAPATAPPPPAPPAVSRGGFPTWAIVLLIIIVLAAIWWWMAQGQKPGEPAKQGAAPAAIEYAAGAPLMIPHWG